jgi:uncharacterized membrane protein
MTRGISNSLWIKVHFGKGVLFGPFFLVWDCYQIHFVLKSIHLVCVVAHMSILCIYQGEDSRVD